MSSLFGQQPEQYDVLVRYPVSRAERRELHQPKPTQKAPDWLTVHPKGDPAPPRTKEGKALMFVQFEMVLPRILEQVCAGSTVSNAIRSLRPLVNLDEGAFMRWLKRKPEFWGMYLEALEVRSEVWTGRMIEHASGVDPATGEESANDVSRDKLAVDTYWKLIQAQDRKRYGDIKQVQIDQQISITSALDAARNRARTVIDVEAEDVDLLSDRQIRQLTSASSDDEGDEE